MRTARPTRFGFRVSAVGLGCWQLGGDWGDVDDERSRRILEASLDGGVTFYDTADVYGDGRSERTVGKFRADHPESGIVVATKMGRRADPHVTEQYSLDNFRAWTDRSRENLGMDRLDLVQLHCPPRDAFNRPATYEHLQTIVDEGRAERVGVSVEYVDDAMRAIAEPVVSSVQIIVNAFRRKPLERFLGEARDAGVLVIARVPLASGLLSGKYDESTTFAENDHRHYNRDGAAFDIGETFAGVPYDIGVAAAQRVASFTPEGMTTAQMALRWLLDQGVDTIIPGARSPEQAAANAAVGSMAALPDEVNAGLAEIYNTEIREHVHGRW